nr:MAG TPA: portal protein [Caudoviricetes sp.]
MGFFKNLFANIGTKRVSTVQMVQERGNGFFTYNGKMYQSDIVRACIRPKIKAIGKLTAKHIRETITAQTQKLTVNPEPYIRFLLEEPNQYMTGQMLQEKLAAQLILNNNAFAVILRDENGFPNAIFPVAAMQADAVYDAAGNLYLKFYMQNGQVFTFAYDDVIHLRGDFYENDIFGDTIAPAIIPLMEIVTTTDQGIVKAIRNSAVIRWLLMFNSSMRSEDIQQRAQDFANSFLNVSTGTGVAAVDAKAEAKQIDPKDYVPNAAQMDKTTARIYALFNTNERIVTSIANEDEQSAYFDAEIEPVLKQLSGEYTRKLFSRRERSCGNRIVFEASAWDFASTKTKLDLLQMVDRGALTPNEWRRAFNLAPVPGGDKPIRRLDTQPVDQNAQTGDENT